ncbi:MAG: 4-hydroxy-3-methylbut-2-enyl diphosphate reductase [Ectothiorhodospiraceae bacterium AqS1]|nr:4-hydroxy-3-methylbut-2-enyl diphosphate reductase [Ectothiorhodospiraceae bacterium AqS1]
MEIVLATPRGFCAGVERAIDIVDRALEKFGAPIYVRHEVVHNRSVVEDLTKKGTIFVDELDEIPDGSIVIFSAHGVSKAVRKEAARRALQVFDATCPLVTKVHVEVLRYQQQGLECILIGHAGHPEVEGTIGQFEEASSSKGPQARGIHLLESSADVAALEVDSPERLAYITQTTLSVDDAAETISALKERFPTIQGPRKSDICYATQNRQNAVKRIAPDCDVFVVVGSVNSSNSSRLREIAARFCASSHLVDTAGELDRQWFEGAHKVGVTAGASAPEALVRDVIDRLIEWGGELVEVEEARSENVTFSLPKELA